MTTDLIPIGQVTVEYLATWRILWRGEVVRVVSMKDGKAQIARKGIGLRWVRLSALTLEAP